jgi:hypothetical protein
MSRYPVGLYSKICQVILLGSIHSLYSCQFFSFCWIV